MVMPIKLNCVKNRPFSKQVKITLGLQIAQSHCNSKLHCVCKKGYSHTKSKLHLVLNEPIVIAIPKSHRVYK